MRSHPWYVFACIVVLAVLATWIAVPGDNVNLFNVKNRTQTKLGLDLKGGVHAVLQARPAPGQTVDSDVLSGLRDTIVTRGNRIARPAQRVRMWMRTAVPSGNERSCTRSQTWLAIQRP